MIVVDANIIAYFTLEGPDPLLSRRARQLAQADENWLLPSLWRHEYLNVMTHYVRAGFLDLSSAESAWAGALAHFSLAEQPVPYMRALEYSVDKKISAYDAQYLALAEQLNAVLVTEDKKLRAAAPELCKSMEEMLR